MRSPAHLSLPVVVLAAGALAACLPETAAVYVDGDGFPELTGAPSCEATIAKGETLYVTVPVDADTAYVRLAVEDWASSIVLVQNWADEGGPSAGVAAEVTIPPDSSAAPGTYYLTVDLCSTGGGCENPYKQVVYERLGDGTTFGRTDYDSPPRTQVGEAGRDTGLEIQTFELQ
ncbi:MAG: hypothetical protein HYS27_19605 [Deltaproteobacteria bacterium]|nr:hypothetical protein [Deltaproteobacteria bacterium]